MTLWRVNTFRVGGCQDEESGWRNIRINDLNRFEYRVRAGTIKTQLRNAHLIYRRFLKKVSAIQVKQPACQWSRSRLVAQVPDKWLECSTEFIQWHFN